MNRNIFKNMGGWTKLFFLLFFTFTGLLFAVFLIGICTVLLGFTPNLESLSFIRLSQVIQTIFVFLIPPLVIGFLFYDKPNDLFRFKQVKPYWYIVLSMLLILVIQPFIELTGYLNQQITLPESMAALSKTMKEMEESAKHVTDLLLSDKSVFGIILNLVIIAALAGIAEEFFFRGCMQRIFKKIFKNVHIAVWVTAAIFSAIHFQFEGFFARMLLGAVLGYLFVWSGSLWIPMLVHFVNNAMVVIYQQYYYGTPEYASLDTFDINSDLWLALLSLTVSAAILFFLHKFRVKKVEEGSEVIQ